MTQLFSSKWLQFSFRDHLEQHFAAPEDHLRASQSLKLFFEWILFLKKTIHMCQPLVSSKFPQ